MNRRNCYIPKPLTNIENYFEISKAGVRLSMGSKMRSRMDKSENKRSIEYRRAINRSELNIGFTTGDIARKDVNKFKLNFRITMISKIPMLICGESLD